MWKWAIAILILLFIWQMCHKPVIYIPHAIGSGDSFGGNTIVAGVGEPCGGFFCGVSRQSYAMFSIYPPPIQIQRETCSVSI
jgi:hypothetical protein